jgi:hypothetical protein
VLAIASLADASSIPITFVYIFYSLIHTGVEFVLGQVRNGGGPYPRLGVVERQIDRAARIPAQQITSIMPTRCSNFSSSRSRIGP